VRGWRRRGRAESKCCMCERGSGRAGVCEGGRCVCLSSFSVSCVRKRGGKSEEGESKRKSMCVWRRKREKE
jgi:hypothetical protein